METADALRLARDKIKTDFFVLSADLITNVHFQYLVRSFTSLHSAHHFFNVVC
jgi:NDP-sugar pyrophosphorylase family protein